MLSLVEESSVCVCVCVFKKPVTRAVPGVSGEAWKRSGALCRWCPHTDERGGRWATSVLLASLCYAPCAHWTSRVSTGLGFEQSLYAYEVDGRVGGRAGFFCGGDGGGAVDIGMQLTNLSSAAVSQPRESPQPLRFCTRM